MGSATTAAIAATRAALPKTGALTTGRELFQAVSALVGTPALAAALADGAADEAAKAKVVADVFGGLGAGARAVLTAASAARWSSADDLVSGLEEVAIRAIAGSAPKTVSVSAEIAEFARAVASDADLEYAVGSSLVPGAQRSAVAERLLGGRASSQTTSILVPLVGVARGRRIGRLLRHAARIAADEAGQLVATVESAAPLAPAQLDRLRKALAAARGRDVAISTVVDPAIIGGLRVVVGDEVIDGSVATRISELRLALTGQAS